MLWEAKRKKHHYLFPYFLLNKHLLLEKPQVFTGGKGHSLLHSISLNARSKLQHVGHPLLHGVSPSCASQAGSVKQACPTVSACVSFQKATVGSGLLYLLLSVPTLTGLERASGSESIFILDVSPGNISYTDTTLKLPTYLFSQSVKSKEFKKLSLCPAMPARVCAKAVNKAE